MPKEKPTEHHGHRRETHLKRKKDAYKNKAENMDRQRRCGWAMYYAEMRERYQALDLLRQVQGIPQIPTHVAEAYKELRTKYDAEKTACSICLDPITFDASLLTACGHLFHKACIDAWIGKEPGRVCPECGGRYAEAGKRRDVVE